MCCYYIYIHTYHFQLPPQLKFQGKNLSFLNSVMIALRKAKEEFHKLEEFGKIFLLRLKLFFVCFVLSFKKKWHNWAVANLQFKNLTHTHKKCKMRLKKNALKLNYFSRISVKKIKENISFKTSGWSVQKKMVTYLISQNTHMLYACCFLQQQQKKRERKLPPWMRLVLSVSKHDMQICLTPSHSQV